MLVLLVLLLGSRGHGGAAVSLLPPAGRGQALATSPPSAAGTSTAPPAGGVTGACTCSLCRAARPRRSVDRTGLSHTRASSMRSPTPAAVVISATTATTPQNLLQQLLGVTVSPLDPTELFGALRHTHHTHTHTHTLLRQLFEQC